MEQAYTVDEIRDWLSGQLMTDGYRESVNIKVDRNELIKCLMRELEDGEDGINAVVNRNNTYRTGCMIRT